MATPSSTSSAPALNTTPTTRRSTRFSSDCSGPTRRPRHNVDRSRITQDKTVPEYDPSLWYVAVPDGIHPEARTATAGSPATEAKWIEVDLSEQYLWAWQYDQVFFSTAVSTGTYLHPTPTGTFHIYAKYSLTT